MYSAGKYSISVKYAGQNIPGSPFIRDVAPSFDEKAVKLSGEPLRAKSLPASLGTTFDIDTRDAGDAPVEVGITVCIENYVHMY